MEKIKEELKLEEIQKIELELLKKFDKICKENNFTYFMFCGTLLGAVKYKKFIPWDDDIDVVMPREDYIKLIEFFKTQSTDEIELFSVYTKKDYYYPFAKLIDKRTVLVEENKIPIKDYGIFLDVFPLDGLPENEQEIDKYMRKMRKYANLITTIQDKKVQSETYSKRVIKSVIKPFLKLFGNRCIKIFDKKCMKYSYKDSTYVGRIEESICYMDRKCFETSIPLKFEDASFPAPVGFEECLVKDFGDYRRELPKEEQVRKHNNKSYWK